jgi:Rrf2 family protein
MKWNKSTRFALYACMEMARAEGELVTIPFIAEKYSISPNHLAKVMQQLVRFRIAEGTRGVGGGYRLVRKPKEITLLDIVEIFEGPIEPDACLLPSRPESCGLGELCRLKLVFDEIEQQAYFTLKSTLLSNLVPGTADPTS